MASVLRVATRRFFSSAAHAAEHPAEHGIAVAHIQHEAAEEATAAAAKATWKKISQFVAIPGTLLVAVNTYIAVSGHEHGEHGEHGDHHEEAHKFGTYLHIRNKPFPWGNGNDTLFWSDHYNKH